MMYEYPLHHLMHTTRASPYRRAQKLVLVREGFQYLPFWYVKGGKLDESYTIHWRDM